MADEDRRVADDGSAGDSTSRPGGGVASGDVESTAGGDDGTETASDDPAIPDERAAATTGRSEVLVPMALYKVVTVFSTLFAVAFVVGGMIALDAATGRATADASEVNLPIAFLGVAAIVLGAAIYAFAARFRAEGMGNPKDRDDQP